jgi:SAM-dependent methyltransferase
VAAVHHPPVTFDHAMATLARLTASAEALAALGAALRADTEGLALDPAVAAAVDGVVAELGIDPEALTPPERGTIALFARAFLRQAADLIDHPERPPGWGYEDPVVLLSLGRGSASIVSAFAQAPELVERLSRDGAALLDVGAGVAALSVEFCRAFPGLRVVGLEPWPPALRLGQLELADAGLSGRIELRAQRVEELADDGAYDVAWLAGPFLPPPIVPVALRRTFVALRPGGRVVFGLYAGPPDPLAQRLVALRTIRSGGHPATGDELAAALSSAGFAGARELERTWAAPVRLIVARKD